MKVLVLFGSESDSYIYEPLVTGLKKNHEVTFEVISAHRNPDRLAEALSTMEYDTVVAGAGIAAHLPGVIASKTAKPVFGVPVEGNLGGIDALLSIQQMPFGVPVMACGPGKYQDIINFLNGYEETGISKTSFDLIIEEKILDYEYVTQELERTKKLAAEKNINLEIVSEFRGNASINLVHNKVRVIDHGLCINVPIFDGTDKKDYTKALTIFDWARAGGLWVGINNTRNAILSLLKFN